MAKLRTRIKTQIRRAGITVFFSIFHRKLLYKIIGLANKRWHFLTNVFVGYPSSAKLAQRYSYPKFVEQSKWDPKPVGLFNQNGKWGLFLGISSTEVDFKDPGNSENLKLLADRTENIRRLLNASQKTFAGILPGVLFTKRIIKDTIETAVTVEAVLRAEKKVRELEKLDIDTPVIILGGKGFIGRRVAGIMEERTVHIVEKLDDWPHHLNGKPAILINISRTHVLSKYMSYLWKNLVLLNEVYPAPSQSDMNGLNNIGCSAYHLVGVKAKAYPKFPNVYSGGVPCCAARFSSKMEVIVRKL